QVAARASLSAGWRLSGTPRDADAFLSFGCRDCRPASNVLHAVVVADAGDPVGEQEALEVGCAPPLAVGGGHLALVEIPGDQVRGFPGDRALDALPNNLR